MLSFLKVLFLVVAFQSLCDSQRDGRNEESRSHEERVRHRPNPQREEILRPQTSEMPTFNGRYMNPTSTSAPQPTCPCVKKPGSNECIVYDTRLQATSVEEAIVNFPDLTKRNTNGDAELPVARKTISVSMIKNGGEDKPTAGSSAPGLSFGTPAPQPVPVTSSSVDGICPDDECKICSSALLPQLTANGLLDEQEADSVRHRLGASVDLNSLSLCSKYNVRLSQKSVVSAKIAINRKRPTTSSPKSNATTVDQSVIDSLKSLTESGLLNWNNTVNVLVPVRPILRKKRQDDSSKILGTRHKIGCIKRGDPLDKNSDWVSLCDACWVWRKLPSDYFPQYINELICDTDQKCLSGWGTCKQQSRNVDILRNMGTNGKDDWQAVTLESSNFCECAVKTGSALHTFVTS